MITDKHHRMSYSIGGVIANLAYNGDDFWGNVQPSRQSMLDFMVSMMQGYGMMYVCNLWLHEMKGQRDARVEH